MVGKAALVTGAAGGVGRAVVSHLVRAGYRVVAADLANPVEGSEKVDRGADVADSDAVISIQADSGREDDARRCVERAVRSFGRLDLLVNNAGRFLKKPITECSAQDWDEVMNLNARGPFLHAREALPHLRDARGAIVNVGSTAGVVAMTNQSVYGASKAALLQLTRTLAVEFAPEVRVNAVAPGGIDTAFSQTANQLEDPAARQARTAANYPLQRWSTADEVAAAIVFLGSAAASAITGAVLSVDGGYTAR